MSDTTTTTTTKIRRPPSERQIAANRLNSTKSTGAKTEIGRLNSSMNNCQHGLFSTKEVLPSESPIERQKLVDDITVAVNPSDGVERLLTARVIETAWKVRRGARAQDARASRIVKGTLEGAASKAARRAETLGVTLDESVEAYHELLSFPDGLAYLLEQCSIILKSLREDVPLLASQRQRCFSLIGKRREHVLRDDQPAIAFFLALAGSMYGREATLDDILALLGTDAPEWMQDAEFVTRGERLQRELPAQARARELLTGYITEVEEELEGRWTYVSEVAQRDLELDAAEAAADATPAGISLANAIDKVDRSCMAALRRLEARQKPSRPGPKRGPKQPAAAAETLHDLVEPGQTEAAAVAAGAQDTVAAAVPTEDPAPVAATTTAAEEPAIVGAPIPPSPVGPGPKKCEDEANCVYGIEAPDYERLGPEADRLRKLYHHLHATDGTDEAGDAPVPGPASPSESPLDRTGTDSPRARAMEQRAIRTQELSRQLDAHFGIDGERPEPGGPAPVSDGAFVSGGPEPGDSS